MSDHVAPKPPDRVSVRIVACPQQEPLVALFCGRIEGLLVHQVSHGRSWGCAGDQCPTGVHKTRTLWYGYAPGRWWRSRPGLWLPAVLEVTANLELQLRGRDLVGEVWILTRANPAKKNSPVQGCFLERRDEAELCRAFDIRPPLFHMYGQAHLDLGVPNPMPPKLALPAIEGGAPDLPIELQEPPEPETTPQQLERIRRTFPSFGTGKPGHNGRK